jgi:hypothetical protein
MDNVDFNKKTFSNEVNVDPNVLCLSVMNRVEGHVHRAHDLLQYMIVVERRG